MDEKLERLACKLRKELGEIGLEAGRIDETVLGALAYMDREMGQIQWRLGEIERRLERMQSIVDRVTPSF